MKDEDIVNDYLVNRALFEIAVGCACTLSADTAGRMVDSRREQVASVIFGKIALHSYTILHLLPTGCRNVTGFPFAFPDCASVFVLARAAMEGYCTFYYTAIEDITEEERNFRFLICDYHALKKRVDFTKSLHLTPSDLPQLELSVESLKTSIEKHSLFLCAPEKKKILNGEKAFLYTNQDIIKKSGINPNIHKPIYDYLSNYTHGFPLCLEQVLALSSLKDVCSLMIPILTIVTAYLHFAIRDFVKLFPEQHDFLDANIKYGISCCEERFGIRK